MLLNTVPKRECHGLFLAVSGATTLARLFEKLKIPLYRVYIFTDAISCILGLKKAPSLFKPPFNRYFSEIHCMLLEVGLITNQKNSEFIHWIDQQKWFNPADLLSKFCLESDTVDSWMSKAEEVLRPGWLQNHPDTYLQDMLDRSKEKIDLQASGGIQPSVEISEGSPDLIHEGDLGAGRACCEFLIVGDSVLESSPLICNKNYAILERLVSIEITLPQYPFAFSAGLY